MTTSVLAPDLDDAWPALPLDAWKDTYATVHMWTQVIGKICLATTALVNHWWNVAFAVTPRGLATPTLTAHGRVFSMSFDFVAHCLMIRCSDGDDATIPLQPRSVADFYREVMRALRGMSIDVEIWTSPVEIPNPIPFEEDTLHRSYDAERMNACFRALVAMRPVFERFRSEFTGKSSPVHFFWGGFDLCVTRFSGRRAPARTGANFMDREAYSHEVISAGFWPGNDAGPVREPAFYAYAAPEPEGLRRCVVEHAHYDDQLRIFILPYDVVSTSPSPSRTYDAAAWLAGWTRAELERFPPWAAATARDAPDDAPDDADIRGGATGFISAPDGQR
jgi:hypothetical protein